MPTRTSSHFPEAHGQPDPRRRWRRDALLPDRRARRNEGGGRPGSRLPTSEEEGGPFSRRSGNAWPRAPAWFVRQRHAIRGVSLGRKSTTARLHRPLQDDCEKGRTCRFLRSTLNDSGHQFEISTTSMAARESLVDGIRRRDRQTVDDGGQGSPWSARLRRMSAKGFSAEPRFRGAARARVIVTEADPICGCQAAMDGYQVTTLEDVRLHCRLLHHREGNRDVIPIEPTLRQMKGTLAIVGNIGHFDNEIQVAQPQEPQVDEHQGTGGHDRDAFGATGSSFCSEGRLLNLRQCHWPPSFVLERELTNQVLAQIETLDEGRGVTRTKGLFLPKHLDERSPGCHLAKIGVKLTELAAIIRPSYIGRGASGGRSSPSNMRLLTLAPPVLASGEVARERPATTTVCGMVAVAPGCNAFRLNGVNGNNKYCSCPQVWAHDVAAACFHRVDFEQARGAPDGKAGTNFIEKYADDLRNKVRRFEPDLEAF